MLYIALNSINKANVKPFRSGSKGKRVIANFLLNQRVLRPFCLVVRRRIQNKCEPPLGRPHKMSLLMTAIGLFMIFHHRGGRNYSPPPHPHRCFCNFKRISSKSVNWYTVLGQKMKFICNDAIVKGSWSLSGGLTTINLRITDTS